MFRTVCLARHNSSAPANGIDTFSSSTSSISSLASVVVDTASSLERVDDELVDKSHGHAAMLLVLPRFSDGLSRQAEKRLTQAVRMIAIRIGYEFDVLGGTHESRLTHGHGSYYNVAGSFQLEAATKRDEIG